MITGFSFAQKHFEKSLKNFKKSVDKTIWKVYNKKVPYLYRDKKVHWKVNNKSFKRPSGNTFERMYEVKIMMNKKWVN